MWRTWGQLRQSSLPAPLLLSRIGRPDWLLGIYQPVEHLDGVVVVLSTPGGAPGCAHLLVGGIPCSGVGHVVGEPGVSGGPCWPSACHLVSSTGGAAHHRPSPTPTRTLPSGPRRPGRSAPPPPCGLPHDAGDTADRYAG